MSLLRRSDGKYASLTTRKPLARSEDLVIEELEDELLIYDRSNKQAHCLSATAARVWRACDGKSDVEAIATTLELSPDAVTVAIEELEDTELLESSELEIVDGKGDGNGNGHGFTRRQLAKRSVRVGGAVAAAPLILSITAPSAWATPTPPNFFCEIQTSGSCGAGNSGCGSIFGCCCCDKGCSSDGQCKACSSINTCTGGNQPCAGAPGPSNMGCSDQKGTNPFTVCGCCKLLFPLSTNNKSSDCGCGWGGNNADKVTGGNFAPVDGNGISTSGYAADKSGNPIIGNPGSGCCDMSSTGPASPQFVMCTSGTTCVPCCNGLPIYPGSHFGCCGGYTAANPQTDACVDGPANRPPNYPTSC